MLVLPSKLAVPHSGKQLSSLALVEAGASAHRQERSKLLLLEVEQPQGQEAGSRRLDIRSSSLEHLSRSHHSQSSLQQHN